MQRMLSELFGVKALAAVASFLNRKGSAEGTKEPYRWEWEGRFSFFLTFLPETDEDLWKGDS
jgi:hypothetical protein